VVDGQEIYPNQMSPQDLRQEKKDHIAQDKG
jgi:hypothetical protein